MRGHGNDASAKGLSNGKDAFGHGARAHFAGRGDTVIGELRANGVEILLSSRRFLGVLVSWPDPVDPTVSGMTVTRWTGWWRCVARNVVNGTTDLEVSEVSRGTRIRSSMAAAPPHGQALLRTLARLCSPS